MKEKVIAFSVACLVAVLLNFFVLKLFKQKSVYRAEHSLFGIICLMLLFSTLLVGDYFKGTLFVGSFLLALIPCYLGTVFPDLDIRYLGIGAHRNVFFHSGILFFFLFFLGTQIDIFIISIGIAGFGIGIGSHLLWDLVDRANIRGISSRKLSQLWLGVNGLACLFFSWMSLLSFFDGVVVT
jgi:hypothetical protein